MTLLLLPRAWVYGIDPPRKTRPARQKDQDQMKRLSVIALLAAAIAFTGCKKDKKDENKPATTETKPAAGTAAPAAASPARPCRRR